METSRRKLFLLIGVWLTAAIILGALGFMRRVPPPLPQLLIAALTISLSVAIARVAWLKEAFASLGVRGILAVHVSRIVGIYFLWLYAQGRMPQEFAYRAGFGDIATAALAFGLLFWPEGRSFRRALVAWNVIGAVDLLVAVSTASWLTLTRPGSMVEITMLPAALIPLCAVPFFLSSHIYLLRTMKREPAATRMSPVQTA